MSYIVRAYSLKKINLSTTTTVEDVLQNLAVIVSTPQQSVPLDRGFGMPQRYLDKPLPIANQLLVAEVLDAVEEYEPRAEIVDITFEIDESAPGRLIPILEVNVLDE